MRVALLAVGLALLLAVAVAVALAYGGVGRARQGARAAQAVPIGILGDSDSQSYQGRIPIGSPGTSAGGAFHATTLQWPEVLARLRPGQVDLGEWGVWGLPRWLSMARVRDGLALRWRGPRKEDYRHNLAWPSGCDDLNERPWRQTQRLVDIMDEDPEAWRRGVVVIRIGVNDFGKESLDLLAVDSTSPSVHGQMQACVRQIREAVRLIRQRHVDTRIVVVGIFNNVHWPEYLARFQAPDALRRIDDGLDAFDNALRSFAGEQPGVAFFDDRAWFSKHWGGRDPAGQPAYRTVVIGDVLQVTNTAGDAPSNSVIANGHAGLVWNVLWVQELVGLLRSALQVPIDPVTDDEVRAFVAALLRTPR
ncbi:MAG: SGNH/GDSL hydrolase family protein [Vitreoscilla sp.]|nr:SGNH/GDSL hydrolase family protein [Vitreoscilla sp.]